MKPPDLPGMGWCDRPLPAIQFKKRVEDAHGDDDEDDLVAASPLRAEFFLVPGRAELAANDLPVLQKLSVARDFRRFF